MGISDARGERHVRCPKCHSVLQEPSVPVYKCGGCGTSLRAKIRTGSTQEVVSAPSLESGLPPQGKHLGSRDVASTSVSTPDAPSTRHQDTDTTSRRETGDLVSARKHATEQVRPIENKEHDQSANQEADGKSEHRSERDAGDPECSANAPNVSVNFSRGSKVAAELQDSEKRREAEPEPDAASKKDPGEAAQPPPRDLEEVAPTSTSTADSQSARAVLERGDDAAAAAEGKAPSPPRHALQPQNLTPLHKKILKTVDELKGDLSELFCKSPEVKPRTPARPPRLPKQEGYVSRPAMARGLPTSRARHAAAADHPSNAGHVGKPGQAAPRGLPSRRYRWCRADPCRHSVHPRSCHHNCCNHGKPECRNCRAHCCRPRAQEPAPRKPPAKEVKRRAPPRNHCRPVLKGAPFIVCSSCFKLVQVPADFAVSSKSVRKLRCGSCSTILSYSYRDPDRKKHQQSIDQYSTDGSEVHGKGYARPDPFLFIEDFGHGASYSTEDEQPLHVSRNSSFNTVDAINGVELQGTSLHRLMGYGSASELLFRYSPDLYESFDKRTTPDVGQYDRKGKGVCVDVVDDDDDDDSDEEDSGALKRSNVRGAGWSLPGILSKGIPAPGAIRIKS